MVSERYQPVLPMNTIFFYPLSSVCFVESRLDRSSSPVFRFRKFLVLLGNAIFGPTKNLILSPQTFGSSKKPRPCSLNIFITIFKIFVFNFFLSILSLNKFIQWFWVVTSLKINIKLLTYLLTWICLNIGLV